MVKRLDIGPMVRRPSWDRDTIAFVTLQVEL
jgi:hypothetical protein